MDQNDEAYSYDVVPYPCHPYPQSHPDRLCTLGTLFGMNPKDIKKCRVLELGCADGSNIIPMAVNLPKAKFVGVDLSQQEIDKGKEAVAYLKLKNIELKQMDIMDVDESFGSFDYIIVHGIISWVPEHVQDKILSICDKNLAPDGIAYVSYNTFPGWHMRGMLRDMMLYHTQKFTEPEKQIGQARALINFLADSIPTENNAYGMLLKAELEQMKRWQNNYFFHDSLEKINDPIYFHDFAERSAKNDLQYLGEAEFSTMLASNFPEEVQKTLKGVGRNIIDMEQYMDFLRNRMFRQTLLCHKDIKLNRAINPTAVKQFYIASPLRPGTQNPDVRSGDTLEFEMAHGAKISSNNPLAKATWLTLSEHWPDAIKFDDLLKNVYEKLELKDEDRTEHTEAVLADILLKAYSKNMLRLYSNPPDMTIDISKKPKVNPLVRFQAEHGVLVTNQLHEIVRQDQVNQYLIQELDGKHDRKALIKGLNDMVADKKLTLKQEDEEITDEGKINEIITQQLEMRLNYLARSGLLIS